MFIFAAVADLNWLERKVDQFVANGHWRRQHQWRQHRIDDDGDSRQNPLTNNNSYEEEATLEASLSLITALLIDTRNRCLAMVSLVAINWYLRIVSISVATNTAVIIVQHCFFGVL